MGSLLTTSSGAEITLIGNGDVFLDFVAGTVTLPNGTVSNMNKNLNDLGLTQCNSIGVWCSDADAQIFIGSAVSLSDHQLNHVVCNYGFSNVRIHIPANSTPDATNQIFLWHRLTAGSATRSLASVIKLAQPLGHQMLLIQFISQSTLAHTTNF